MVRHLQDWVVLWINSQHSWMQPQIIYIYNTVYMYIYNISWVQSFGVSVLSPSSLYTLVPWSFKQTGSQSAGGSLLVLVLWVTQGQVDIIKIDIDSYVPRPGQLPFDPHDPPKPPNGDTERAWCRLVGEVRASLPLKGRTTVLDGGGWGCDGRGADRN